MNEQLKSELKAYVFATYIGQKVFKITSDAIVNQTVDGYFLQPSRIKKAALQLRSLSTITDSEAIEVAYLKWPDYAKRNAGVDTSWVRRILDTLRRDATIYQYLQQQSFALPIFYKGVQYSVDELQGYGIYSIKN